MSDCQWWKNILVRNVLILLIYLVIHLTIQGLFQGDKMCPPKLWRSSNAPLANLTSSSATPDQKIELGNIKKCRKFASVWFTRWGLLMKDMSKIITFLVGFYVSTIVKRWWEQVRYLPFPVVATHMQIANIIEDKKVNPEEALSLKKKIMRYFHLRSRI